MAKKDITKILSKLTAKEKETYNKSVIGYSKAGKNNEESQALALYAMGKLSNKKDVTKNKDVASPVSAKKGKVTQKVTPSPTLATDFSFDSDMLLQPESITASKPSEKEFNVSTKKDREALAKATNDFNAAAIRGDKKGMEKIIKENPSINTKGATSLEKTTPETVPSKETSYEDRLNRATLMGQGMEAAKFGLNASRLAKNQATMAPQPITPKRNSLLNYQEVNPDFSSIDKDVTGTISQMRAMGLGGSYINAVMRSGLDAKRKMSVGINEVNRQGRLGTDRANAGIEAGNNKLLYDSELFNANRNAQLGAMKGQADTAIYGSLFDNATNMYNLGIEKSDKIEKKKLYDKALVARQGASLFNIP